MLPNKGNAADADNRLERELAGLKAEYERLRDDKVRTEQDLTHLTHQLAELEARAQADYGTSDPEALRQLLAQKREENARLVTEYRQHIAGVRQDLEAVEREFAGESS